MRRGYLRWKNRNTPKWSLIQDIIDRCGETVEYPNHSQELSVTDLATQAVEQEKASMSMPAPEDEEFEEEFDGAFHTLFGSGKPMTDEQIKRQKFVFTIYNDGMYGKKPVRVEYTFDSLLKVLSAPAVCFKSDIEEFKTWSNHQEWFHAWTLINEEEGRCAANIDNARMLVLDVDDGAKMEEVAEQLEDYYFIIYTSKSYCNYKEGDRFRVVLFCKDTYGLNAAAMRDGALREMFPYADPASWSDSQGFVMPCHMKGKPFACVPNEGGKLFDFMALKAVPVAGSSQTVVSPSTGQLVVVPLPAAQRPAVATDIDESGSYGDWGFTPNTMFDSEMDGFVTGGDLSGVGDRHSQVKCLWHHDVTGGGYIQVSKYGNVNYWCSNTGCAANAGMRMVHSEKQMYLDGVDRCARELEKLSKELETVDLAQVPSYCEKINKQQNLTHWFRKKLDKMENKINNKGKDCND